MKISKREKRFIMFGALALLGTLLVVYVIEPVIASQLEVRKQIEKKQAVLKRYRPSDQARDHYQSKVRELSAQLDQVEGLLLKEKRAPLAAAKLQGLLHKLCQETGMTIVREKVLAPNNLDLFVEVPVELSLRGDLKSVRDFLYRVQTAPYLLTLPKQIIRRRPSRKNVNLTVALRVVGYMRGEEKS